MTKLILAFTCIYFTLVNAQGRFPSNTPVENKYSDEGNEESDEEVALIEIERKIEEVVQNIFRKVIKLSKNSSLEADISLMCLFELSDIFIGMRHLDSWAFRMMDSYGKIPVGLLEGTASSLGDYDECLDIVIGGDPTVEYASKGKYCLLEMKPPHAIVAAIKQSQWKDKALNYTLATTKTFLRFLGGINTNPEDMVFRTGICVPGSCNEYDVQELTSMAPEGIAESIEVMRCETKDDMREFKLHELSIIISFGVVISIVAIGTAIDCFLPDESLMEISSQVHILSSRTHSESGKTKTMVPKLLTAWSTLSMSRSLKKLLECSTSGDALDPARGLKVFSIIFMIFGHTYALPEPVHMARFRNALNFFKFMDSLMFGMIANSAVGVDTFFVLAGFLFVYNRWKLVTRPSVFPYIGKFLLLNYLRMFLAQTVAVGLFSLFPFLGSGPLFHEFVDEPLERCEKTWWMNLLFIQIFLKPNEICIYPTWMLATIMQLFLFTSVLIWIMDRWPVIGMYANVFLILFGTVVTGILTIVYNFPATVSAYFFDYRTVDDLWKFLYSQSYTHIGPYCIGMILAYNLADAPPKQISRIKYVVFWLSAFATKFAIVFGLYGYRGGKEMDRVLVVLYATLHRPAWAMAISWTIYACASGYGGAANSFLSWRVFVPLERLCYFAYLLHVPIMHFQGGIQRELLFMGHYNQVMCFFSNLVTSFGISFGCYLLFQAPYEIIEAKIFGTGTGDVWKVGPTPISQERLDRVGTANSPSTDDPNSLSLRHRCTENNGITNSFYERNSN